jgi:antitoxin (DNA-binding transcriptional repressor) of toxin-antitoxin stability system
MSSTGKSISVSQLKARLSQQLRRVKAGETVLITERGRPIAMMNPLPPEIMSEELAELVEAGLVRPSSEPLAPGYWDEERPADPEGSVRQAIIDEREEGR